VDRVLGGVCGGLAESVGVDSGLVRLVALMSGPTGLGAYLLLWVVLRENPEQPKPRPRSVSDTLRNPWIIILMFVVSFYAVMLIMNRLLG